MTNVTSYGTIGYSIAPIDVHAVRCTAVQVYRRPVYMCPAPTGPIVIDVTASENDPIS